MNDILTGFDYSPPPASRTKRWVACFIDYFIYFSLVCLGGYAFGERYIDADGSIIWHLYGFAAFLGMFLPWLILFPGIESFNSGQTIGKSLFKVRTLKDDYTDLNFKSALIRHLCDLIDYFPVFGIIGLLVTTNNKHKQRIGDLVAKTVVVDATYVPPIKKYS
jgi:uncharacterized RDD family membrane protein YckC